MLCDRCHGKHVVLCDGIPQPCEECGGLGVLHCCEGLQAQPGEEPSDGDHPRIDVASRPAALPARAVCNGSPPRHPERLSMPAAGEPLTSS